MQLPNGESGDNEVPEPFWCKLSELQVRGGRKRKLQLQFLPFFPGSYACQIVFLDPAQGEFVYEVKGTATLPEVSQELRFISTMKPSIMKDVTIPFVNPALKAAQNIALDRLDRKARAQELRIREARSRERAVALEVAAKTGAGDSESKSGAGGVVYDVEFSSPFFDGPRQMTVTEDAVGGAVESPSAVEPASPAVDPQLSSPFSRRSVDGTDGECVC